nr:integrase, catalytic region, zinc finger, CCHC-type, peptidase aspartic, catalytic [Tanacetum cinerariifolium]
MDKVDLLQGSRSTNLYTISLNGMMYASPVCLLTKASSTKSWLWHRRLNHLNFGTLNDLARNNLDIGKLKAKADISIFMGYSPTNKAYRVYNSRTQKIQETVNVTFDELSGEMTSEHITPEAVSEASSSKTIEPNEIPSSPLPHVQKWTKDHPLENVIGDAHAPVSTRK